MCFNDFLPKHSSIKAIIIKKEHNTLIQLQTTREVNEYCFLIIFFRCKSQQLVKYNCYENHVCHSAGDANRFTGEKNI